MQLGTHLGLGRQREPPLIPQIFCHQPPPGVVSALALWMPAALNRCDFSTDILKDEQAGAGCNVGTHRVKLTVWSLPDLCSTTACPSIHPSMRHPGLQGKKLTFIVPSSNKFSCQAKPIVLVITQRRDPQKGPLSFSPVLRADTSKESHPHLSSATLELPLSRPGTAFQANGHLGMMSSW